MKKSTIVFLMLLASTMFSCRTVKKDIDREKTTVETTSTTETKTEGVISEETKDKQDSETNAVIIDNNSSMTIAPIDPMKPSFFTDPATGKKMSFENSKIIYRKEQKTETVNKKVESTIQNSKKEVNKGVVKKREKKEVKINKESRLVNKDSFFGIGYFSIFIVIFAASFLLYKRRSVIGFFTKKILSN
jgi:hypothetical protein